MPKTSRPRKKKCCKCGKPFLVFSNHKVYCPNCDKIRKRMSIDQLSSKTRQKIWKYIRKYGYVCYYTGMLLDMTDPRSAWYCVLNYCTPHDPRKVVLTSALVNVMKSGMTEKEFWYMIRQLAGYKLWHTEVRKIRLAHWVGWGHAAEKAMDIRELGPLSGGHRECHGCGRRIVGHQKKYCSVCANLAFRLREERVPRQTIEAIWAYIRKYGFVCYYTGMPLNVTNPNSPWYIVFDHWMPRDTSKLVITSALINLMKSDLTEDEFWYYIKQLANHKEKHTPVRKRKLVSWYRLYLQRTH